MNTKKRLKICFIANAHSIHVRTFTKYFCKKGHDVYLITPDKCLFKIRGINLINIYNLNSIDKAKKILRDIKLLRKAIYLRDRLKTESKHIFFSKEQILNLAKNTIDFTNQSDRNTWNSLINNSYPIINKLVNEIKPDIVQSLRFYPEGLICSKIDHPKKIYFVWGSDISGFGTWYPEVGKMMMSALQKCCGIITDNMKDYRYAKLFGLPELIPHLLIPSNGGIDTNIKIDMELGRETQKPHFATFRRMGNLFMDNEPIIKAISILRNIYNIPATYTLYGNEFGAFYDKYRILAKSLGIWRYIRFERQFTYDSVYKAISKYKLQVSPAVDDGCSNALLETMWVGGIPIYSNLESIREWITDGDNGYLFNMNSPEQIAQKFIQVLKDNKKYKLIAEKNRDLVRKRADYITCMKKAEDFYYSLL